MSYGIAKIQTYITILKRNNIHVKLDLTCIKIYYETILIKRYSVQEWINKQRYQNEEVEIDSSENIRKCMNM